MRGRSYLMPVAALSLIAAGCRQPPPPLSNDDIAAIQGLFEAAQRHLQSGDFVAWAALYTEDAVLMPPNHPMVEGRAAIQAYGEALPSFSALGFSGMQIDGIGSLAIGSSSYTFTARQEGRPEVRDSGKQLVVLRKQPDGSWLVTTASYNSDLPLPP